jgi:hypothetical protein
LLLLSSQAASLGIQVRAVYKAHSLGGQRRHVLAAAAGLETLPSPQ